MIHYVTFWKWSVEFIKNADMMWKQSVWTSSIAAALAAKYLKEGGIITLPGAAPCVGGTAGLYNQCTSVSSLFIKNQFFGRFLCGADPHILQKYDKNFVLAEPLFSNMWVFFFYKIQKSELMPTNFNEYTVKFKNFLLSSLCVSVFN